MSHNNAFEQQPQLEGTEPKLLQVRERAATWGIASLDELRQRAEAVLRIEIVEDSTDQVAYAYHNRDWCQGYQTAFRDLLRELEKGKPRVT